MLADVSSVSPPLVQSDVLNMGSSDSQIDKPQRGCPKRAELLDININTGTQSINTERASLALRSYLPSQCS